LYATEIFVSSTELTQAAVSHHDHGVSKAPGAFTLIDGDAPTTPWRWRCGGFSILGFESISLQYSELRRPI
jgi:hypothetical protein